MIRMMETGSLAPAGRGKTLNMGIACGGGKTDARDCISET